MPLPLLLLLLHVLLPLLPPLLLPVLLLLRGATTLLSPLLVRGGSSAQIRGRGDDTSPLPLVLVLAIRGAVILPSWLV